MTIDWVAIRNEFESTDTTLKTLADKYGISDGTIRSRKNRESWQRNATGTRNVATQHKPVATKVESSKSKLQPVPELTEELTDKQQIFVMEYLKDFNATRAAMVAGYSKKTAYSIGWELLRKPGIQAAIQQHKDSVATELGLSVQRIISEYMRIAFADVSDYLDFGQREVQVMTMSGPQKDAEGKPVMKTVNYVDLKPSAELDVSLIAEVKQGRDGVGIKLHSKMEALEALTKYLDVLPDHHKRMIEEKKLELQAEQVAIAKTKVNGDNPPGAQDDGFIDALKASAKEVWADEVETSNVPMVSNVNEADQSNDLVDA